jgi:hypothetical protein
MTLARLFVVEPRFLGSSVVPVRTASYAALQIATFAGRVTPHSSGLILRVRCLQNMTAKSIAIKNER